MVDPQYILRRLQDYGFTPEQAAAIGGNIQQESSFNPSSVNGPEGAIGLMQWLGDRRTGLEDYAKAQGTSPFDLETQIGNIARERQGPEAQSFDRAFSGGGSPGDLARRFAQYVERPSDTASFGQRAQYADSLAYPSPAFTPEGGTGPDQPIPYETAPRNPFAATKPGILLGQETLPSTAADVHGSDPYQSAGANFGDMALRTLNPLNLVGTALSLPMMLGTGMRNAVRGAVGLPSDLSKLQGEGDLYEQALHAYGVPVENRGYSPPPDFGRGTSPIADWLGQLTGADLSARGREQERLSNLEDLYKLTGIREHIAGSAESGAYRQHMMGNADERLRLAQQAASWKTPDPRTGLTQGQQTLALIAGYNADRAAAQRNRALGYQGQVSQFALEDRPATGRNTDPNSPDFGMTPKEATARRAAQLERNRAAIQKLLEAQHKNDPATFLGYQLPGAAPDNSLITNMMDIIDRDLPPEYQFGKGWWYRDQNGKASTNEGDRTNGITTQPPERPAAASGAASQAPSSVISGSSSSAPPVRITVPDTGANLAPGESRTEGGAGASVSAPSVGGQGALPGQGQSLQHFDESAMARARAAVKAKLAAKGQTVSEPMLTQMAGEELKQAIEEQSRRVAPR